MKPALLVLASFLPFLGTHLAMGLEPFRGRLVARHGEHGFVNRFSVVATLTFALWVATTAAVRQDGAAGLGLAHLPAVRFAGISLITAGVSLAVGSLASYARSPMALFSSVVREPYGIERISRHGFFAGLALVGGAHVLLAPTLSTAVFFAALSFHATFGAIAQDRKLLNRYGEPYREYLEQTSGLPFLAILLGRQSVALGEQPWLAYAMGLGLTLGLRQVHGHIFDAYGLWIVAAVVLGGGLATWSAERAQKQERTRHA